MLKFIFAALVVFGLMAPATAGVVDPYRPGYRFVVPPPAFPKAKDGTITLWYMPGGVIGEHIRMAMVWRDRKYRIVIKDDQYSAAAMMVLWLHVQGSNVCAVKGADTHWHTPIDAKTFKPIAYRDLFITLFGRENTDKIGKLSARKFKRIAPSVFGIPRCK